MGKVTSNTQRLFQSRLNRNGHTHMGTTPSQQDVSCIATYTTPEYTNKLYTPLVVSIIQVRSFARSSYCRCGFARSAHFTSYGNPVSVCH